MNSDKSTLYSPSTCRRGEYRQTPPESRSAKCLLDPLRSVKVIGSKETRRDCHGLQASEQTKYNATSLDGILGQTKEIRKKKTGDS